MEDVRLDKYLWAVRIFKTRSDAAEAVRTNKVLVNDAYAKPSREVKCGDRITVRRQQVVYSYRVVGLVTSRQPAKNVPEYCVNVTPQEELAKLDVPRETVFVTRDRGTGRPTKKERRELDSLMDGIFYDDGEKGPAAEPACVPHRSFGVRCGTHACREGRLRPPQAFARSGRRIRAGRGVRRGCRSGGRRRLPRAPCGRGTPT